MDEYDDDRAPGAPDENMFDQRFIAAVLVAAMLAVITFDLITQL